MSTTARGAAVLSAMLLHLAAAGELPRRLARALVAKGKDTLDDLGRCSLRELMTTPNVGPIGRQIVRNLLANHGYDVTHLAEACSADVPGQCTVAEKRTMSHRAPDPNDLRAKAINLRALANKESAVAQRLTELATQLDALAQQLELLMREVARKAANDR